MNRSTRAGKRLAVLILLPALLFSVNCAKKKDGLLLWPLALMGGGGGGSSGGGATTDENGEILPPAVPEAQQEVATEGPAKIEGNLVVYDGDLEDTGFDYTQVTVKLVDPEGNVVATTTVNADGSFVFDVPLLGNDNYRVLIPDGNGVNHGHVDFNFVYEPGTGPTAVALAPIQAQRLYYLAGPARIEGGALTAGFRDAEGRVIVPAGALPAGTEVLLLDAAGDVVARTTTGSDGAFVFALDNLENGNYLVRVRGAAVTDPAYGRAFTDVEVALRFIFEGQSRSSTTLVRLSPVASDWQHALAGAGQVRGAIYNVANGGDLSGITLRLKNAADEVVATAVTDAAGAYSLSGTFANGVYTVEADGDAFLPTTTSVNFVADPTGVGSRAVDVADLGIRPRDSILSGRITDGETQVSGAVISFRPAADHPPAKLLYLLGDELLGPAVEAWLAQKCGSEDPRSGNCSGSYTTYVTKAYEDDGAGNLSLTASPGKWRFYVSAAGYLPSSDPAAADNVENTMFLNGQAVARDLGLTAHTARSRITGRVTVTDRPGAAHQSYCQTALGGNCAVAGSTRAGPALRDMLVIMLNNTHNGVPVAHLARTDANGEYVMTDLHVALAAVPGSDSERVAFAAAEYRKFLSGQTSLVIANNADGIYSDTDYTNATLFRANGDFFFKVNTYSIFSVDPRGHIRTALVSADNSAAASTNATGLPAYDGAVLDSTGRAAHLARRSLGGVVSDAVSTAPLAGAKVELGLDADPDPGLVDFRPARRDAVPLRDVSRLSADADEIVAAVITGADGAYAFANINPGSYVLRVTKGDYVSTDILVIVPEDGDPEPVNPQLVVDGDPGNLTGWIKLPGGFHFVETYTIELTHPTSGNRPLSGVQPTALTSGPAQFSNAPQYSIFGLTPGQWKLRFVSPGFQTVEGLVTIQSGATTTFDIITMVPGSHPPASVTGRALNALTNAPLGGLVVRLRPGVNIQTGPLAQNLSGEEIAPVTTGASDGTFSVPGVPPGDYTLEASGAGFATTYRTVISAGVDTPAVQDILVSPILAAGEVRIVLAWNDQPKDLDSHLEFGAVRPWQAVWNDRSPQPYGSTLTRGDINLDIDVTWGRGPETVTLKGSAWQQPRLGYSVFNWSRARNRDTLLSVGQSGATVRVFKSQGLVRSFAAGPGQVGDWWQLFCLNAAREITDVGQGSCRAADFFNAPYN